MARFIDDKTGRFGGWAEQRTAEYRISNRRITKDGIVALCLLNQLKWIEYLPSIFDIRYSLFDIRFLILI